MITNSYATLQEYIDYVTARGQSATSYANDDAVILSLLDKASRHLESQTGRVFYPFVQTRYFDVPAGRELMVNADLLEVISASNGDGASIPSTEYYLVPRNTSPAYAVKITDVSAYYWTTNAQGSFENAVTITGLWGYHDNYQREAWRLATTTAEALDASETEIDVSDANSLSVGQILKVDSELLYVTSIESGKVKVQRGINGSTAATHLTGVSVYYWRYMPGAVEAVLETAMAAYHRRFGKSLSNTETITAAGVIVSPRDVPYSAASFISIHRVRL